MTTRRADFYAGDLFGELQQPAAVAIGARRGAALPGLVLAVVAALAAAWLAGHYGFPIILLGLLIGLSLSFLAEHDRTAPGLDLVSRHALRLGIVLLGLQVTFAQIGQLGFAVLAGMMVVMGAGFGAAMVAARLSTQPREAGIVAGSATAICGISAALAVYGVIGDERLDRARFAVTLVAVTLASAMAMAAYPVIASMLGFSDAQAGFLIGVSVHDAAQAIGGGYSYSDAAGADATVVKLARVAMLAPLVALVAALYGAGKSGARASGSWRRLALPSFIVGFFAVVAINSFVALPREMTETGLDLSKTLLLLAVVATAIRARLGLLMETGWRALMPVVAATVVSGLVAIILATMVVQ